MAESLSEFAGTLLKMIEKGKFATHESLLAVALKTEAAMKVRVREGGVHPYGTRTTARPGGGPAVISGDLSRSITHEEQPDGYRVGPASIPHTRYGRQSPMRRHSMSRSIPMPATTGQIGGWLEAGTDKMPAYPFVQPALDDVKGDIEDTFRLTFEKESW